METTKRVFIRSDPEHGEWVDVPIVPLFGVDLCELCGNVCCPWGDGRKCMTCFTRLPLKADSGPTEPVIKRIPNPPALSAEEIEHLHESDGNCIGLGLTETMTREEFKNRYPESAAKLTDPAVKPEPE